MNPKTIVNNAKRSRIDEEMLELFKKQIDLEILIEKVKCKLALKVDFNIKDLFCFLDITNKGAIDKLSLER